MDQLSCLSQPNQNESPSHMLPTHLMCLQALAKRLDHANWKERNAALEAMEEMVKAAGGRITPSLGEVMPALKVRTVTR